MRFHLFLLSAILVLISGESRATNPGATAKHQTDTCILLQPTDQTHKGLPVLEAIPRSDERWKIADLLLKETFIREAVRYNGFVQSWLKSTGKAISPEPVYLLISGRQGGFPMKGFYLRSNGRMQDKSHTPYVELAKIENNYTRLNSITQIFPHELAHIYYEELAETDPSRQISYSSDMHYYSITTDYFKAFNEGYAESFENIARDNEKYPPVSQGIQEQVVRHAGILPSRISGFERDFNWPLRIGYYRLSMIAWYQQLEDYKRYTWTNSGKAIFPAAPSGIKDLDERINVRNACVEVDPDARRNLAQLLSNEGFINTFFTKLMQSSAKYHYQDSGFYAPFLVYWPDEDRSLTHISPIENQVMKEFFILGKYLGHSSRYESPFYTFLQGYSTEFPDERPLLDSLFIHLTGTALPSTLPPQIWLTSRTHAHSVWVMAQFGGANSTEYSFNLNTAEAIDLMTIRGISEIQGNQIINYRDSVGYFKTLEEVRLIPGIEATTVSALLASKRIPANLDQEGENEGLNIVGFLLSLLFRLLIAAFCLSLLTSILLYLFFPAHYPMVRHRVLLILRTFFKSMILILPALFTFMFPYHPFWLFLPLLAIILIINLIRKRRNSSLRPEVVWSWIGIGLMILYSLY